MILKEKVGEDEYILDTTKLKDIEFPFYTPCHKSAYCVPADKSVYLPVKFRFENKGRGEKMATVSAKLMLPGGGEITAKVDISYDDILAAITNAIEEDASLFSQAAIAKAMQSSSEAVYNAVMSDDYGLILGKSKRNYPVFLFQRNSLIAVTNTSEWSLDGEDLVITMENSAGTFLRAFKDEKDRSVSIVVIDDDGNAEFASLGTVQVINGNSIKVKKEKNTAPSRKTILDCEDIYKKYKDNYMNYFLDKEDKGGEEELELESFFKAD